MKIGVLASGGGTNLQSIIDACKNGYIPDSQVVQVISNKQDAFALERAKQHMISSQWLKPPQGMKKLQKGVTVTEILTDPIRQEYDQQIKASMVDLQVDLVCMAGYMFFVTPILLDAYDIINIHPALLPAFPGMYGIQDAWEHGAKVIGCTTHFADENLDQGPIIIQSTMPMIPGEDLKALSLRNLRREHIVFPESLRLYQQGLLIREGRKVVIQWDETHYLFHQELIELWRNDIHDYYHSRQ